MLLLFMGWTVVRRRKDTGKTALVYQNQGRIRFGNAGQAFRV
jgi:hypothetical protein